MTKPPMPWWALSDAYAEWLWRAELNRVLATPKAWWEGAQLDRLMDLLADQAVVTALRRFG